MNKFRVWVGWLLDRGKCFSTIRGEYPPVPGASNVPFEQVCAGPLFGNDVLQLPSFVCVRLDGESDCVEPISQALKHVGGAPIYDLHSSVEYVFPSPCSRSRTVSGFTGGSEIANRYQMPVGSNVRKPLQPRSG